MTVVGFDKGNGIAHNVFMAGFTLTGCLDAVGVQALQKQQQVCFDLHGIAAFSGGAGLICLMQKVGKLLMQGICRSDGSGQKELVIDQSLQYMGAAPVIRILAVEEIQGKKKVFIDKGGR